LVVLTSLEQLTHLTDNLLCVLVEVWVGVAGHARHRDAAGDVLKGLAQVHTRDGDVGATLPRPILGTEQNICLLAYFVY
jgi:hypothetical protein